MQVRLAFSIAMKVKSDILLLDEVLAVGDASFQQKCYEKFEEIINEGRSVVLVTHDMSAVLRFCDRAAYIEKGVIEMIGRPNEIADKYLEQNLDKDINKTKDSDKKLILENIILSSKSGSTKNFGINEEIEVGFTLKNRSKDNDLRIGLQIFSNKGVYCFGTNSKLNNIPTISSKKCYVKIRLKQSLGPGTYNIGLAVMNKPAIKVLRYIPVAAVFNIRQGTEEQGVLLMKTDWEVNSV